MNLEMQEISLDINDNKTYEYLYAKQGEQGREIIINITKDGLPFDISDTTVIVNIKKPDNTVVLDSCTIIDSNKIKVVITEQISVLYGNLPVEIQIVKDSAIIKTITTYIKVEKSVVEEDDVISSDEYNALNDLLIKATKDYTYVMENAQASADSAANSASAAKTSESNAKKSETNAKTSATTATNKASEASTSATNAANSADEAENSATTATTKANEASASASSAKTSETNAKKSETASKTSETNAKTSETNAKSSETNALASANSASTSATNAANSASTATTKATEAKNSATSASTSATTATTKASEASNYATEAKSFARGGTGTRTGEDSDNAKYYYEQARSISEGLNGTLLPMGTITFSQLQSQSKISGYMYNISDSFTTDSTFKDGIGVNYPAGTNVYYTADGYWDCLAGRGTSTEVVSATEPTNQIVGDFWLQSY